MSLAPPDPDRLPGPRRGADGVVDGLGDVVDLLLVVAGVGHPEGDAEAAVVVHVGVVGEGEDAAGAGVAVVRAADLGHLR